MITYIDNVSSKGTTHYHNFSIFPPVSTPVSNTYFALNISFPFLSFSWPQIFKVLFLTIEIFLKNTGHLRRVLYASSMVTIKDPFTTHLQL